jgi:adenylate kinase
MCYYSHIQFYSVVLSIADNRPKTRYILALDESHNTLHEIVRAISAGLGPNRVKEVPKEDALLDKEVTVSCLTVLLLLL